MADDLSLLFRLRAENSQAKATLAETRAAVAALRSSFGSDLSQMQGAAKSALSDIGSNVNTFVGERIPLIGGAFLRITSNLKGFNDELKKGGPQTAKLASDIDSIAKASGKSSGEVTRFLTTFVQLESQAKRDAAALEFVGAAAAEKLIPQLEAAGQELVTVAAGADAAGVSIASMAGGVGIAVVAVGALVVAAVALSKEIFELAKSAAEFQGRLFDLSQQTGVSVETLSALEVVARTTGGSIDSLSQSLGIFQKNLEDAVEDPGSKAAVAFHKLGVEATDTETALRQTIASLARMPEGFKQTALALEVFGRGGKAFLAIAKESKGDINEIIDRLKGLGLVTTEQAKLADEFNDQLVLLQVQLRGLGTEVIPIVLDSLKDFSSFLRDNKEALTVLRGVVLGLALSITVPLKTALATLKLGFELAQPVLENARIALEAIKAAIEFISGHPLSLPGTPPAGSPETGTKAAAAAVEAADLARRQGVQNEIADRKQLQGLLNFMLADEQRQVEARIALAQREFDAGKRTRQQLLDVTIDGTQKQTQAEIDALKVDRAIKVQEEALAKDDVEKRTQIGNAIIAIDTQIANKRAAQTQKEADLRAKARLDEQKAELTHQGATLDTLIRLGQNRIAVIEDQIKREVVARQTGIDEIEEIENTALEARGQLLKKELQLAGVGPERQVVLDKIKALEADRTELERKQSERRREIAQQEFETKRSILTADIDTALQLEQSAGERRVASLKAQADRRVITEEDAAKQILKIRLDLIDDEIEATRTKLKAAGSITGKDERARVEAELNNHIKVLTDQRVTIQTEGNREIDDARQKDIENERKYVEALVTLNRRIVDGQRDVARTVIDLMVLNFARRADIIKAQAQLDIDEENRRNKAAQDDIRRLRRDVNESNRTREEKLAAQLEIDELEETEAERHRLVLEEIRRRQVLDEKNATPSGRLGLDIDNLKEFASVLENSIVPLGEILTNTFKQVSDAIGQTVANWVLLGETGPAVMRKILAQALASIAAEAAVNAIKELALGFATLFFNPAESAAHFTAAALWGSIGGVAALAGRGIAGDLFKQKSVGSSGGSGSQSTGQLNPLTLNRNQPQTQRIIVEIRPDGSKFGQAITAHILEDGRRAGPIREFNTNDGAF